MARWLAACLGCACLGGAHGGVASETPVAAAVWGDGTVQSAAGDDGALRVAVARGGAGPSAVTEGGPALVPTAGDDGTQRSTAANAEDLRVVSNVTMPLGGASAAAGPTATGGGGSAKADPISVVSVVSGGGSGAGSAHDSGLMPTSGGGTAAGSSDAGVVRADDGVGVVGVFPIVSFVVVSCSSTVFKLGRRTVVHACLGRALYLVWDTSLGGAPASVDAFRARHPTCVRLGREAGELRLALPHEVPAIVVHPERLLWVRGVEQSSAPGGEDLSSMNLLLQAPSAAEAAKWAEAATALLQPWPSLLSFGAGGESELLTRVHELLTLVQLPMSPPSDAGPSGVARALGARGRRLVLEASRWLAPPSATMKAGASAAMKVADAVDAVSGVPVVGPGFRLSLFAVHAGALIVHAGDHDAIRVAASRHCVDVLDCILRRVAEALHRDRSDFNQVHIEQLCRLLQSLETVIEAVERSFFADRAKGVLMDGVVRGWEAKLNALHDKALSLAKDGARQKEILDGMGELKAQMSSSERSVGSRLAKMPNLTDYKPPSPDTKYVAGVYTPDRAEHSIMAVLRAYVVDRSGKAPRLGVCGVGGGGKSTACKGVAACNFVREHFSGGTTWVSLNDQSSRQALVDAAVALVCRLCGAGTARELLPLSTLDSIVTEAARRTHSVPVAEAAQHLVMIDGVCHSKRDLLQQLLRVVPPATPVLFTTRSQSVVSGLGFKIVLIDGLPDADAKLMLAQAVTGAAEVQVDVDSFNRVEEPRWDERVVRKTKGHALSISIVCAMIADSGGAWSYVVEALEQRWMEADFMLPDGGLDVQRSVRATLETSLELLHDAASRVAFQGLGILPTSKKVSTDVLDRLWGLQLDPEAVVIAHSAGRARDAAVGLQVNKLVQAGLLQREVNKSSGVVDCVSVHPVIGEFARSLLGDDYQVLHSRLVHNYLDDVGDGGTAEHGLRVYPLWAMRDDGYWFDHVAYHAAACGEVSVLVSLMERSWRNVREQTRSPLAYQADVEVVAESLRHWVDNTDHEVQRTPALLSKVYQALSKAHIDRVAGDQALNSADAVHFAQRALQLSCREAAPLEWAETQNLLGVAYRCMMVDDRTANEKAIDCYLKALEVRTKEAAPLEWAKTQLNLGNAYDDLVGGDKEENWKAVVACYERALEVMTRDAAPLDWATAQFNVGNLYFDRVGGERAANVEEAIVSYKRALEVLTRDAAPLKWAVTQMNLGNAHRDREGGDQATNVKEAASCYELALKVLTRDATPRDWAKTQFNLGNVYYDRVEGDKATNLEEAVACYKRALEVETQNATPRDWAATQKNLGNAYFARVSGDKATNLEEAIACYTSALKVVTRDAAPLEWAALHNSLGRAHRLREVGDKAANVEKALACHERALEVLTRDATPLEWARTQYNLSKAYQDRLVGDEFTNEQKADAYWKQALEMV